MSDTDVGEVDLEVDELIDVLLHATFVGAERLGHVERELAVDLQSSVVATFQVVVAVCHRHLRLLVQLDNSATTTSRYGLQYTVKNISISTSGTVSPPLISDSLTHNLLSDVH